MRTYSQLNRTLFAALKLKKGVMFLILTLIIVVASLNIASTLILRSVEKTKDIGLLKAMGATPPQIRRMIETGAAGDGMGPKLEACMRAVEAGVHEAHIINGVTRHSLLLEIFTKEGVGTMVTADGHEAAK